MALLLTAKLYSRDLSLKGVPIRVPLSVPLKGSIGFMV